MTSEKITKLPIHSGPSAQPNPSEHFSILASSGTNSLNFASSGSRRPRPEPAPEVLGALLEDWQLMIVNKSVRAAIEMRSFDMLAARIKAGVEARQTNH